MKKITLSAVMLVWIFLGANSVSAQEIYWNTNTGLDKIVTIIQNDKWLQKRINHKKENKRVTQKEINTGSKAANWMNNIIVNIIKNKWFVNDWNLSIADVRELNDIIHTKYYKKWMKFHWDDENNWEETGYHLVQNDWWKTKIFWKNALNNVFDTIYHLGFETNGKNRLLNEDWDNNKSFKKITLWLSNLLKEDIKNGSLKNSKVNNIYSWTTGTGLDKLVNIIINDNRLDSRIYTKDILAGAKSADKMNQIIISAIKNTKVASDWNISPEDVKIINKYIVKKYKKVWLKLHWDDENWEETGFHLVQNDWAKTKIFGKNAVNKIADWIYHLGFETNNKNRLLNEDWNKNATFKNISKWLNNLLKEELKNWELK
jgi:hypothetical protein